MKWKKEKCHRIIDESLTNELTQLVKHSFSSPPPSFFCIFSPTAKQSIALEKIFDRKQKKRRSLRAPQWHSTRKSVELLLLLLYSSPSLSSPVLDRSYFDRTKITLDRTNAIPIISFIGLCVCLRLMEQWHYDDVHSVSYICDWVWASERILFFSLSCFYVSEWVFLFALSLCLQVTT